MRQAGLEFKEDLIPLYEPGSAARILQYSPTGKVPVLVDGDMRIWESLAILDHLAEHFPRAGFWPKDVKARAHARAISAEMHCGFAALRRHCPMNMRRKGKPRALSPEAAADIKRIDALWTDCRARFGRGGPFLFGAFTAADAMYAPVASRIISYAISVGVTAQNYTEALAGLPAWKEWEEAGIREPWRLPQSEVD